MPNIDSSVLPLASSTQPGLVKPGTNTTIDGQGNFNVSIPSANNTIPGLVKIDPTTLVIDSNGVLKVVATAASPATTTTAPSTITTPAGITTAKTGWVDAVTGSVIYSYNVAGTMLSNGTNFYATDFGTGSNIWHGPVSTYDLGSNVSGDFTFDFVTDFNNTVSPNQLGGLLVQLLDNLGNVAFSWSIADAWVANYLQGTALQVGGTSLISTNQVSAQVDNNDTWHVARVSGQWTVTRNGTNVGSASLTSPIRSIRTQLIQFDVYVPVPMKISNIAFSGAGVTTTTTPGTSFGALSGGSKIQSGVATPAGAGGSIAVTFPVAFNTPPLVFATPAVAGYSIATITGATTTGFTLYNFVSTTGAPYAGSPNNWMAIGT